jgi:hypothetical protein
MIISLVQELEHVSFLCIFLYLFNSYYYAMTGVCHTFFFTEANN